MADTWIVHHERGETVALVASTDDHVDVINHAAPTDCTQVPMLEKKKPM